MELREAIKVVLEKTGSYSGEHYNIYRVKDPLPREAQYRLRSNSLLIVGGRSEWAFVSAEDAIDAYLEKIGRSA